MNENTINDELFDVLLKNAVDEYCLNYLAELPSEEEFKQKYPTSAAVFIMIFSLSSLFIILSPTVQAAVKEVVMQWFPKFSSYEYYMNAADIKNIEWEFTYIPKGYVLSNIHFSDDMVDWEYTNNNEDILYIYSHKASSGTTAVDNEHSVYSQIMLNGVTAELYTSNEIDSPSYLLWVQDGYSFDMVSYLKEDELIKIAKSLRIKQE